jgi:hypothetical protein
LKCSDANLSSYTNLFVFSLLFSFVAFAKRPLHLKELKEAVTMALSENTRNLDPLREPIRLQRLFAPLIETQHDPNYPDDPLCRLCHATVQEFLASNPNVLGGQFQTPELKSYQISSEIFGDTCLRYLSQEKYSKSWSPKLSSGGNITTSYGYWNLQQHFFLPYSAKYWAQHLSTMETSQSLSARLYQFLKSRNFPNLLRTQCMTVTGQFEQYQLRGGGNIWFRPQLPRWLDTEEIGSDDAELKRVNDLGRFRRDYLHFVREWGYLLEHRSSPLTTLDKLQSQDYSAWNNFDQCLTGLLGSTNFMSTIQERHASFMLSRDRFDYHRHETEILTEGLSTNDEFTTVSSSRHVSDPGASVPAFANMLQSQFTSAY